MGKTRHVTWTSCPASDALAARHTSQGFNSRPYDIFIVYTASMIQHLWKAAPKSYNAHSSRVPRAATGAFHAPKPHLAPVCARLARDLLQRPRPSARGGIIGLLARHRSRTAGLGRAVRAEEAAGGALRRARWHRVPPARRSLQRCARATRGASTDAMRHQQARGIGRCGLPRTTRRL